MTTTETGDVGRDVRFVRSPALWPTWPFLPVVRRRPGRADELGVVFDGPGACGLTGPPTVVYRCNLFALPPTLTAFLALPREAFDTADALVAGGWSVD